MKKLISTIALVALLVGCGKAPASPVTVGEYEEYTYPTFLSTDWGMSEDETFKALGIEKDSATLMVNENDDDTSYVGFDTDMIKTYEASIEFDKTPLDMGLIFTNLGSGKFSLTEVRFAIPDQNFLDKLKTASNNLKMGTPFVYDIISQKDIQEEFLKLANSIEYDKLDPKIKDAQTKEDFIENQSQAFKTMNISHINILGEVDQIPDSPFGLVVFKGNSIAQIKEILASK